MSRLDSEFFYYDFDYLLSGVIGTFPGNNQLKILFTFGTFRTLTWNQMYQIKPLLELVQTYYFKCL